MRTGVQVRRAPDEPPVWSRELLYARLMRERYGDPEALAVEALLPWPQPCRPVSPGDRAYALDEVMGARAAARRRSLADVSDALADWQRTRTAKDHARFQAALAAHAVLTAGDVS